MDVSDNILAALFLVLSLGATAFALMAASIDSFAPVPNEDTARAGRMGCIALIALLMLDGYLVLTLWNQSWTWHLN